MSRLVATTSLSPPTISFFGLSAPFMAQAFKAEANRPTFLHSLKAGQAGQTIRLRTIDSLSSQSPTASENRLLRSGGLIYYPPSVLPPAFSAQPVRNYPRSASHHLLSQHPAAPHALSGKARSLLVVFFFSSAPTSDAYTHHDPRIYQSL